MHVFEVIITVLVTFSEHEPITDIVQVNLEENGGLATGDKWRTLKGTVAEESSQRYCSFGIVIGAL